MGINIINSGHGQAAESVYKKDFGKETTKLKKNESAEQITSPDKITISSEGADMTKKASKISEIISSNPVASVSALKNIGHEKVNSLLSVD